MRILVIGRHGLVATALKRLGAEARHDVTCLGRNDIDLFSKEVVADAVNRYEPDAVINAAAYTAVDKAESDHDAAYALNAHAPGLLAEILAGKNIPFIHFSTDYVFDGSKPEPYQPVDPVRPINVYGLSKAAGEMAVRTMNPAAVILRTAWIFSESGTNFLKHMLDLALERDELRLVDDQIGNPTFVDDLAAACLQICVLQREGNSSGGGLYHLAGQGDVTWYGFARAIFQEMRNQGRRTPPRLVPISAAEYPTLAARPANSRLNCESTAETFNVTLRNWQAGLAECLQRSFI